MDVCILTAGRGTRLGEAGRDLNKGLLPLQQKAALSHLIERFPEGTRFVVAVGHLAGQVREYLELAHPSARIELVTVAPFEGPGSGPGASALCCASRLPGPFFLVCSDTYWPASGKVGTEPETDVAYTGQVPESERREYCSLVSVQGRVKSIHDKATPPSDAEAWVGFAFVRSRDLFFDGLRAGPGAQGEVQLSAGLGALRRAGTLAARRLQGWHDLGTAGRYRKARTELDEPGFEKTGEYFYKVGDRVLKFFNDPMTVRNRVERCKLRPELFPELLGHGRWFYSYRFAEGETLRDRPDADRLRGLLDWLSEVVWTRTEAVPAEFQDQCVAFYQARTQARIARAEMQLPESERIAGVIDRKPLPSARDHLAAVPGAVLAGGVPSFIHGDLQLDNVVECADGSRGRFRLIDWRQDFAGSLQLGDLYYDFAKLLASIELDFRAVARGEFGLKPDEGGLSLVVPSIPGAEKLRALVEEEATGRQGLELSRLRLLVALVYLNMAGLHSGEESRFLYHLGRSRLADAFAQNGSPAEARLQKVTYRSSRS